tara:strand:+ start:192 stop:1364 length:1173 start_codon:yes stop_codon:yes gene_type:complete
MNKDPITRIDLHPVFVPFNEQVLAVLQGGSGKVAMALNTEDHWLGGDFLYCRLTTEDGVTGVGESFVWAVEGGTTPTLMADTIRDHLARYVLGRSPFDIEAIKTKFADNLARNEFAKGVLDMALCDTAARIVDRPVHDLFGGAQIDRIPTARVLPLSDIDTISDLVRRLMERGVTAFRCKLGDGIDRDFAIVEAVRNLIGPTGRLRVDYNQAYSPARALASITAIAPFGIDFAEQPVRADDFAGMAWLQSRTEIPIMAHEGAFGLRDLAALAELGGVRCFGLNGERPGGMSDAVKAIDYAALRGIDICLHNQPGGIGSAMMLHLHACRARDIVHPTELQGHEMLESSLIQGRIDYDNGMATLPGGPGWGVELDMNAVDHYQTAEPITLAA